MRSSYHNYSYHKPAPVRVSHVEGFEAPASQYVSPASELDPTLPHRSLWDLVKYRGAVYEEMCFQRDKGGNLHKVFDGVRTDYRQGRYVYVFDVESELFLADDAPITLYVGDKETGGTVVACEEFQITLALVRDMDEYVPSARLSANPWQLLEALNKRLAMMNPAKHPLAVQLMEEGPALATTRPISEVPTGQDTAKQHVRDNPITVIWGPPGTGKTHTMAELAIEAITRGKHVLVVSHSNVSVDGIILKVAELMRSRGKVENDLIWQGRVMRYGHVRDERLAQDDEVVSYKCALNLADPDRKLEFDELQKRHSQLLREDKGKTREMTDVQARLKEIRQSVAMDEEYCVMHARLLGTTVSKLYSNLIFDHMRFDMVMFDEVSMAYVPQIVCAAMYATQKLVLVGDFRQLAPIVQSKSASALHKDVFSYLGITDHAQRAHYHPWMVMLNVQRRMHPDIAAFPNGRFYDGLLRNHALMRLSRPKMAAHRPFPGSASTLVNLRGTYCASASNSDHSRFGILSAIVSFGLACTAVADGMESVGVITPYAAQARLVRALLRDRNERTKAEERDARKVVASTVHQFQGSERDLIIFDPVESYPAEKPGILTSNNTNGSVDRLVNVAVTRARGKLITVANASFWDDMKGRDNSIQALVWHHRESDLMVGARAGALGRVLKGLDLGPCVRLLDEGDALAALLDELGQATHSAVISIPDGQLDEPAAGQMAAALHDARRRGVSVRVKCFNTKALPESWQTYAWQSDDAVFPLVVLDGTVCWYDALPSRNNPPRKHGGGPKTTMRTPLRIEGRNAIALIWSFASLETRTGEDGTQTLRERYGTTAEDVEGKRAYGLALHVQEHVKCKHCGAPMVLRSDYKSGRAYLRCSKCKEPTFLPVDEVNRYLSVSQVRCPKCGAELYAKVDRRQVFVFCDGDEHHRLKPSEV